MAGDLDWVSAGELADMLAAGKVSALEAFDAAVARIEARDGPLNAVVVRDFDRALDQAKAADAALARGERKPLLGVPMTVKESHNVAGLPTTWGFEGARGFVADADSVGVARLKAAGAVILGKTNIPVALADWQSVNPIYGRTRNPWNLERSPGGSSGGAAAALASGMVHLEFGSDIGGSVRVPAAFCGVFGHKPTYGIIPARGHAPPGLDGADVELGVVGPLARTAADLDLAMDVLAGPAPDAAVGWRLALPPARGERLSDYRVMVLDAHPAAPLDAQVAAALERLAGRLEAAGARLVRSVPGLPDLAAAHQAYGEMLGAAMSRGAPGAQSISAHAWMDLIDAQTAIRRAWAEVFGQVDVVLAPTFGVLPYPHDDAPFNERTHMINGQVSAYGAQLAWPGMATMANLPSTSAPMGFSAEGLPIGVQVIGPYLEDRTSIGFARLMEREFGGFTPPPGY